MNKLLSIGATNTPEAQEMFHSYYMHRLNQSQDASYTRLNSSKFVIEQAQNVLPYIGKEAILKEELKTQQQQISSIEKKVDKLTKQIAELQKQGSNIEKQLTELNSNSCCVIC